MARTLRNIPKREKKPKVSRAIRLVINERGYGKEPVLKTGFTKSEYGAALSWYSSTCGAEEARAFLNEYLEHQERWTEIEKLARLTDTWIPRTSSWISRIIMNGTDLPRSSLEFLEINLDIVLERVPDPVNIEQSICDVARERSDVIVADVESMVDSDPNFSLYSWLKKKNVKPTHLSALISRYAGWYDELLEALIGKDSQLKEAYHYMTKDELRKRAEFIERLITDAERYISEKKR